MNNYFVYSLKLILPPPPLPEVKTEVRALCLLGKHSTIELSPQLLNPILDSFISGGFFKEKVTV